MEITLFTVRDKKTKELIYAEGIDYDESYSSFRLDKKYFTQLEKETTLKQGSWEFNGQEVRFGEEIRHINHYKFDLIEFNTQEIYEFDSLYSLKKV